MAVARTKRVYDSMLLCGQRNSDVDSLGKCYSGLQSQSNRTAECLFTFYVLEYMCCNDMRFKAYTNGRCCVQNEYVN